MSDPEVDRIVDSYFRRLDEALSEVPRDRHDQLLEELRDHVTQARATVTNESPAAIHEILERIGTPEEIAAAEAADESGPSGIVRYFRRLGASRASRVPMTESRWYIVGAAAGFIFAVASLLSLLIAPSAPALDSDIGTVSNYFSTNVHALIASGLIASAASFVLLAFIGTVARKSARSNDERAIPASLVFMSGTVFVVVAALGAIFTTSLAILAGQSVSGLSLDSYVPALFVLRTVVDTGVLGLAAGAFIGFLGLCMVSAKLVGRWFVLVSTLLAACNAVGGGAASVLGSYNQFWRVVQAVGAFGVAFVVLSASVFVLVSSAPTVDEGREEGWFVVRLGLLRPLPLTRRLAGIAALGFLILAAAIAVPLSTRGLSNSSVTLSVASLGAVPKGGSSSLQSGGSTSPGASVGYDGAAICEPTTDAELSGGSPSALMHSATEVASGTIEGKPWSLWSADGQSGASGLEDGGIVFNGHEYGLCAGYPNPSESEMIDTGSNAILYGVVNYPGLATVQVSTGTMGSFAVGAILPPPHVAVVDGVSFYIGTLPRSACSYSYLEINTTSPSYSAEHGIGFGDNGAGMGYAITNNPGNTGACVAGKLDPLSYSHGAWQLPPGEFTPNG